MLNFSFSSVLISILCCNILIVFLGIIFSSYRILLKTEFRSLNLILMIILFRSLFPFELPITTNIYFPYHLSYLISRILRDSYTISGFSYSIWDVMVLVWILGFLYKFYRYIHANMHFLRLIQLHGSDVTDCEPYSSILGQICDQLPCKKEIRLIKSSFSQEPAVYYYRKYYIMLPDTLKLNIHELNSILSHEIFHIMHHDLLIKNFVHIVSILHWWNPFCILLQKQIDLLLELQVDQKTGGGTSAEKIDYLACLVKVAGQLNSQQKSNPAGLSFTTESGILLNKRLKMLMESNPEKNHNKLQLILLPVCIFVLCSFLFIFEPDIIAPEDAKGTFELTADNSYAVQLNDGTFNIYYNDEYLENTDSLEYYPDDMTIYYNHNRNEKD